MPIPILQYGVKVRDPTTKEFSDLAALRGGQGPQGAAGPGVPAGGTDGDVLVKSGATDYDATWKKTPPQMGSLATIEPTSTVTQKTQYVQGEYLVYNGQLYKVTASTITQGQTLDPTPGSGNIEAVKVGDELTSLTASVSTNKIHNLYIGERSVTVPQGSHSAQVPAPTIPQGKHFLCYFHCYTRGWATFANFTSAVNPTPAIWIPLSDSGGEVVVQFFYYD